MMNGEDIAHVINGIGTSSFDLAVFRCLSASVDNDYCTAFIFPDGQAPLPLARHSASPTGQYVMNVLTAEYAREKYRYDEHIPEAGEFRGAPIVKIIDSTKRTYLDFRAEWRDYPGTRQELAVFHRAPGAIVYLGIYRGFRKADFDNEDMRTFEEISGPVIACLLKHAEALSAARAGEADRDVAMSDQDAGLEQHLTAILLKAPGGITPREAEVCANIILGYRAYAIAERMGISEATVASHRKHAYAKLGICSQTELFGRYVGVIQRHIRLS